jgi:hypothetical protein
MALLVVRPSLLVVRENRIAQRRWGINPALWSVSVFAVVAIVWRSAW